MKRNKKKIDTQEDYMMLLARAIGANNGTCDRARIGVIIATKDGEILVKGWNTSVRGTKTCDEIGHYIIKNHCIRTIHAEQMAIANATRDKISLKNSIAYITHKPCVSCLKSLISCGVKKIYFEQDYQDKEMEDFYNSLKDLPSITIEQYKKGE
jgi:dCMP deaminase